MRDNHKEMPEIIDAFKENDQYSGVFAVEINGTRKKFRFGVTREGYLTLKKVLQLRPFDKMPGLKHQYFYIGGSFRILDIKTHKIDDCEIAVWVEQEINGRRISLPSAKELMQNLNWVQQWKDFSKAAHLPEIE